MPIPQRTALLTLMRLENSAASEVRRILEKTSKQVQRDLAALGNEGNPVTRMQMQAQAKAIDGYLSQDWSDIEKVAANGQVAAAKAASKVVSMYEDELLGMVMDKQAMKNLAASEAQRAANGVAAAMRRMEGSSYIPLSKQVYRTEKLASGWVNDIVNTGLAAGWDSRRIAREISSSINPNVPGGVSYAANRLARSEINNAFHAASAKRYADSGLVDQVDWHLSTSHPEGDICDSLQAESPYDIDEIPRKPHPHCYCYITPSLPDEDEFIDNLLSGKYGDEPWAESVDSEAVTNAAFGGAPARNMSSYRTSKLPTQDPGDEYRALVRKQEELERSTWSMKYGSPEYDAAQKALDKLRLEVTTMSNNLAAYQRQWSIIQGNNNAINNLAESLGISREEALKRTVGVLQAEVDATPMVSRVPMSKIGSILDDGIKSVYETGKRAGANSKLYMEARSEAEFMMFGYTEATEAARRPIYAYLDDGSDKLARSTSHYGDVKIVINPAAKNRATVAAGDTLDMGGMIPADAGRIDELAINWSRFEVIAEKGTVVGNQHIGYVEMQVHGGVKAEEIAELVFTGPKGPSAALIKKLEQKGIPWRHEEFQG